MTTRRGFACLLIITIWLLLALMPRPVAAALELRGKFLENGEQLAPGRKVAVVLRLYDDAFNGHLINEQHQPVLIETGSTVIRIDEIATRPGPNLPGPTRLGKERPCRQPRSSGLRLKATVRC